MLLTEPFMQRLYKRVRQTYGDAVTIPPFGPEGFTVRARGRTICVSLKEDGRIHILIPTALVQSSIRPAKEDGRIHMLIPTALVQSSIRPAKGKHFVEFVTPACVYKVKEKKEYGHIRVVFKTPFNAMVRTHTENILAVAYGRDQSEEEIENIQLKMSDARSRPGPVYTIDD
jgi:hypothetical protein